jgi:hypothetical protein
MMKKLTLIHKTYKENVKNILENGFNINYDEYGRFGYGIYFMSDEEYGDFGDGAQIICEIDTKKMMNITHDEIREIYPYLDYQEGGEPEFESYVKKLGYEAVNISYIDGFSEVVVYNPNLITIKEVLYKA